MGIQNNYYLVVVLFIILTSMSLGFGQSSDGKVYGILVDNTGSLRPDLDNVKMAAKAVVKHIDSPENTSIFCFATQEIKKKQVAIPIVGVEWGNELEAVNRLIEGLTTQVGHTALFDAIQFSAERIKEKPGSAKTLVLITDGQDRVSGAKPKELIRYLKENKIAVYVIGFVEDLNSQFFPAGTQKKAKEFLKALTEQTGGHLIFPKEKQRAEDLVKELFTPQSSK